MMIRQRHEIAAVASLLATTSAALRSIRGGKPQRGQAFVVIESTEQNFAHGLH